jgi:hypothetical protein
MTPGLQTTAGEGASSSSLGEGSSDLIKALYLVIRGSKKRLELQDEVVRKTLQRSLAKDLHYKASST